MLYYAAIYLYLATPIIHSSIKFKVTRCNERPYLPKLACLVPIKACKQAKLDTRGITSWHTRYKASLVGYKQEASLLSKVPEGRYSTGYQAGSSGIIAGKRKEHKDATNNRASVCVCLSGMVPHVTLATDKTE